jgi:hypothetical protein
VVNVYTIRNEGDTEFRWATYCVRADLSVVNAVIGNPLLSTRDVNYTINDSEGDVNSLRAKLAGKRLGQGTLGKLASSECTEAGAATNGGSGTGYDKSRWVRS